MGANRKSLFFALLSLALVAPWLRATPIEPTAKELLREVQRPAVKFEPARVGWDTPRNPAPVFNLTFEQYGPQSTGRAVRASLKAALTPDPLSMAALLFCAFALRWMKIRTERTPAESPRVAVPEMALPRAA